ncbi:Methyltransf_21 domain-containing protein [Durusdinium trenchii]|uniref:Methyltransf_21 domain-containing protein n=1 Tax=Durusdinium trenchii TaxID=1381693 RepID=A0ABP0MA31_9DINO
MVRIWCVMKFTSSMLIGGFFCNYFLSDLSSSHPLGHRLASNATEKMEKVGKVKMKRPSFVETPNYSLEPESLRNFSLEQCAPSSHSERGVTRSMSSDTVVVALPRPHWHHVVSSYGDDHPTNAIRREKIWEGGLTFLMTWALEVACGPESDCLVVDIGMNIGWYTALAAAFQKNVLAFEPNPAPLEFGKKTVRLNGWSSRVRIVNAGLSQDRAPLYVEASLTKSGTRAAERQARAKSLKVPSYRLDDLIDPGAEICFLKADCQGCEGDAFLSGSQLLGAGKIKVVMLEFDHTDRARDALSTLQKLSPRPFHCLLIPLGLTCEGEQINDPNSSSVRNLWDAVVASVMEDCDAKKIDELAPAKTPPGYSTDLWLLRADVLTTLRAAESFVAAEGRRKRAAKQSCSYRELQTNVGHCDLLCRPFRTLRDAQRVCDTRPSCKKILQWSETMFELRGGPKGAGGTAKGYWKEACHEQD